MDYNRNIAYLHTHTNIPFCDIQWVAGALSLGGKVASEWSWLLTSI